MKRVLKKWGVRLGLAAVGVVALGMAQGAFYARREAALAKLPEGATKAQVRAVFGEPDSQDAAGDAWRYDSTLPALLTFWPVNKSDDLLIGFEDGKMDFACVMPE